MWGVGLGMYDVFLSLGSVFGCAFSYIFFDLKKEKEKRKRKEKRGINLFPCPTLLPSPSKDHAFQVASAKLTSSFGREQDLAHRSLAHSTPHRSTPRLRYLARTIPRPRMAAGEYPTGYFRHHEPDPGRVPGEIRYRARGTLGHGRAR